MRHIKTWLGAAAIGIVLCRFCAIIDASIVSPDLGESIGGILVAALIGRCVMVCMDALAGQG